MNQLVKDQAINKSDDNKWTWKDREDNYYLPHKMETRHLFYTFRMIWNHSMPNDAKIYPYHEYRFGSFYTTEYMMVAARRMFNELLIREDIPENFIAQLEFMKDYVIKNNIAHLIKQERQ